MNYKFVFNIQLNFTLGKEQLFNNSLKIPKFGGHAESPIFFTINVLISFDKYRSKNTV